jgi:hypothetical protein
MGPCVSRPDRTTEADSRPGISAPNISVYTGNPPECSLFIRLSRLISKGMSGAGPRSAAPRISRPRVMWAVKGRLSKPIPAPSRPAARRSRRARSRSRPGSSSAGPIHQSSLPPRLKQPVRRRFRRRAPAESPGSPMIPRMEGNRSSGVSPRKARVRCRFSGRVTLPGRPLSLS